MGVLVEIELLDRSHSVILGNSQALDYLSVFFSGINVIIYTKNHRLGNRRHTFKIQINKSSIPKKTPEDFAYCESTYINMYEQKRIMRAHSKLVLVQTSSWLHIHPPPDNNQ